ncbi:RNA-directed DNA polymerase, eukaryota, reverse transcriptase zinc-binding domain protein [Tanacetum coccineum]
MNQVSLASLTGCSPGNLPFKYLGLPIGANMNQVSNWNILVDRFRTKLSSWKANLLSIGGRLTLIKSVLGSIGIYYMSIFKVSETVNKSLEKLRATFFGFKSVNLALLQKWRWRFMNQPNSLWACLIKAIHGEDGGLISTRYSMHGTWANVFSMIHDLHNSNIILNNSTRIKLGCGSKVRFWKDVWLGDSALYQRYNRLFRLDVNEDCYVADRCRSIQLTSDEDSWQWLLGNNGVFTVGETRKHINCFILPVLDTRTRWSKFLPRRINVFMWRLALDRLPHRFNLSRRGFDIDSILCPLCSRAAETKDHLFSFCEIACDVWRLVHVWCGISDSHLNSISSWLAWIDGLSSASVKQERIGVKLLSWQDWLKTPL